MKKEPVAIGAAVAAVANYVVYQVCGDSLPAEVVAGIAVIVNAAIAFVVRGKVSPV